MKPDNFFRCLLGVMCAAIFPAVISAADMPREHLSLDANWKFHMGDNWPYALRIDKAGASTGPAAENFNDDSWRTLNLPHDWAIELPFDRNADLSHGCKPVGPDFPKNSIGWYRHTFELPADSSGKRIWLDFDGIFRDATVWVNGWLVGRHESGYCPFRCDITDVVRFGGANTIAVRVDASKFEGWFYEGAGIYRHVWLDETAPVAIAPDGIFVYSRFKNNVPSDNAEIHVEAQIINTLTNAAETTVRCEIISPDGKSMATFKKPGEIAGNARRNLELVSQVSSPVFWSPENPKLYRLITTIESGGKIVDREKTEFGIRTVALDPNEGFLLNGKHYELKGTCNHQDMAGVGVALPDALQYFRIKKLKEFGCNAYRTSHNPPTPELLEACDRLGMIVMDENRLLGDDTQNMEYWQTEILRDRNHPSVCIWSIANEEFSVQDSPQAANVARTMQNLAKSLDPTRPVTYASPEGDVFAGVNSVIEVRGWNYHSGGDMDRYHAEHPQQSNVGTEHGSTVSTRGIYANDEVRGYVSAYDVNYPDWASTAESWWNYFASRPWLSGSFVWTGFDYRGEPTPYEWPCISSHFGILDTCGFPKDNFYYYQSWWTTNIVLHLLPHWNWPGKEGQEIRVDALSNCKSVELFLNGISLGKQKMLPNSILTWQVKYAPGTLSAKGYDAGGKVIAETKEETTGNPAAIQLTPDRSTINADGEDVSVFKVSVLDAQGREVPVASNLVHFDLSGAGNILGVGNGDPSCHEADTYVPQAPVTAALVNHWQWKLATVPAQGAPAPEYAPDFDDSTWETVMPQTECNTSFKVLHQNQTAIFRAHFRITEADLDNPEVQIHFSGINGQGWVFVNDQRVGELRDRSEQLAFDIKPNLQAGDNLIAVGMRNDKASGGLDPDVTVDTLLAPDPPEWSRSLFNGLAEVMVQSTSTPGEIHVTATADGLQPATITIQTAPAIVPAGLQ